MSELERLREKIQTSQEPWAVRARQLIEEINNGHSQEGSENLPESKIPPGDDPAR